AAAALLTNDVQAADDAMLRALAIEPDAADLLLRTALLHRRAGRWVDAVLALERAAASAPGFAPVWRELGIVREHAGQAGALRALRRAVELAGDFEACVTLALLLARRGDAAEADRLFDRAMRASGGQLNLVLPALIGRARQRGRINVNPLERARLEQVRSIRRAQAETEPPTDAPWSFFDAARASLLLGDVADALALVEQGEPHITAWWQRDTFGQSLDALEVAGVDVAPFRACLGLRARTTPQEPEPEEEAPTPPFLAEPRPAAWYPDNVPCMSACPVGTDAGSYVHLTAEGRFEEAYDVARGPNPFASVCGRVCAAPCEDACRRGYIDQPVEIRSIKRFLTEHHGVEGGASRVERALDGTPAPCIEGDAYGSHLSKLGRASEPRRVAVIGGGPAGMACAHDLALLGHKVTVFEAAHQLGGMMRQGIPVYRLPRDLLDREMGVILGLGVEVKLGTPLTAERTLAALLEDEFDAAFLGTGAGRGRDLEVEGSDLDGVVRAIDFLLNVNEGYRIDLGPRVVVVGGGNVALDVARTARLGRPPDKVWRKESREASRSTFGPALEGRALRDAMGGRPREVHVLARQPMGEWPAQRTVRGTEELEHAQQEGVVFHPLRGLRRILGEDGRVAGVELAEVVQLYDHTGRYAPVYGPHVSDRLACDAVVLAVGQTPDLDYLGAEIQTTSRGLIQVDRETLATSMPGVYAGGDAAFGPRTLIEGVSDGKRAARHIHDWLSGAHRLKTTYRFEELHPRAVPTAEDYDRLGREPPPALGIDRRTGIAEVELGYEEAEAVRQAARCLVCHVQTVYDGDLCIACGRCTEVCPYSCLSFATPDEVGGLDAGLRDRLEAQADAVYMVKDEDRCVRCGLCAERCPTGAMTMERFEATVVEA
nr:FAD-dependent oxidoreductase [Planctomycetota bacterium]